MDAQISTQPKPGEVLGKIGGKQAALATEERIQQKRPPNQKTDKESETGGNFPDQNPPAGQNSSFGYSQTKVLVTFWYVATIETLDKVSWVP